MVTLRKVTICALIVGLAALMGCSGDGGSDVNRDSALVGTWEATGATIDGQAATINDVINTDTPQVAIDGFAVVFQADGDMIQRFYVDGQLANTQWAKWRTSGNNLIFTDGPEGMEYQVDGDQLTVTWTGEGTEKELVFTKQD